jgi:hypothetical protein
MSECQHDFKGLEFSKLLKRWVTFCPKCGFIKEDEPMSERIQSAINSRFRSE